MIDPTVFAAFVLASLVLNLTPGPDMLYTLSRSVRLGVRGGLAAAGGNFVGSLVHTFAAVAGLSALLVSSSTAFSIVKYLGAAYLIYLGLVALFGRSRRGCEGDAGRGGESLRRAFVGSFLVHVLNPKVAVFFLAFLPQFVRVEQGPVAGQLLILGLWFTVQAAFVLAMVALLAGRLSGLVRSGGVLVWVGRKLTGSLFILLGGRLALATVR